MLLWTILICAGIGHADGTPDAVAVYKSGDYARAMQLFLPRARQGDPEAEYYVARMYENAQGVAKDPEQVVKWYELAARHGHPKAQYKMAIGYAMGYGGLKHDDVAAGKWLIRSAENGYRRAQKVLAKAYEMGKFGLPRDPERAEYWRKQAEEEDRKADG